jgi:acyl transferase domain-containing protein/acyl carrier protein
LITPLTSRLQYPIWKKVLKSYNLPDEMIADAIEKMKLAYVRWDENSFPGMLGNVIAGRISNYFDLGGINSVVDAACAASLSAMQMAVSELVAGRSDMMICGGVDTDNSPFMYLCFSKTPAFSQSEKSRPFDQQADGMLIGEGIGLVLLKRLADAEKDGDRIYAVIKGIGSSSDGKSSSIYAPNSQGQALAIHRAYKDADFLPETIELMEAHGTGTTVGDPTEFKSLQQVFDGVKHTQCVALGSVKSQIGHTKAAAGVAGVIKSALALYHQVLPATINVSQPNAKFNIEHTPFYVNALTRPWIHHAEDYPRRAGVSAFGFGGVNVHVAMEEFPNPQKLKYRLHPNTFSIVIYADTIDGLKQKSQIILRQLKSANGLMHLNELIKESLQMILPDHAPRLGLMSDSPEKTIELLKDALDIIDANADEWLFDDVKGIYYSSRHMFKQAKTVALFPGQGSQYVNMGRHVCCNFPLMRQVFEKADRNFLKDNEPLLSGIVYPIPVFSDVERKKLQQRLTQTEFSQPAIGTLSMGYYQILAEAGFAPHMAAGHSFGEWTALWAAGIISDHDYLNLAKYRGKIMSRPLSGNVTDSGLMLAVKADVQEVEALIKNNADLVIANYNTNDQLVIGGGRTSIMDISEKLAKQKISSVLLPVSAAFHTPYVGHAQKPFAEYIDTLTLQFPKFDIYSNINAKPYAGDIQAIRSLLKQHMIKPVLFKEQIENMYDAGGRIFVEIGPRNILSGLVKNILGQRPHLTVPVNPAAEGNSDHDLRLAVLKLRIAGVDLVGFDPYARDIVFPLDGKNHKLNIALNGANYVSEKTRQKFADALETNHCNFQENAAPAMFKDSNSSAIHEQLQQLRTEVKEIRTLLHAQPLQFTETGKPSDSSHKTMVSMPASGQFHQVLLQVISEKTGYPLEMLDLSMELEADLGIDSIKRVEIFGFLQEQFPYLKIANPEEMSSLKKLTDVVNYFEQKTSADKTQVTAPLSIGQLPADSTLIISPAPGAVSSADLCLPDKIAAVLYRIISEKTGYPEDMLDPSMSLETDLGIDSIKRVEILGSLQEIFSEISLKNPAEMAELKTLKNVVDYIDFHVAKNISRQPTAAEVTDQADTEYRLADSGKNKITADIHQIQQTLLQVISEKTGYPAEMLQMDMQLESDLGIDSIKRVEIFGALQDAIGQIQMVNPQAMAGLNTLNQVAQFLNQCLMESNLPLAADSMLPTMRSDIQLHILPALKKSPGIEIEGSVMLVNEGSLLTVKLARLFSNQGKQVIILNLPRGLVKGSNLEDTREYTWPEKVKFANLENSESKTIENKIRLIQKKAGPIGAFIHCNPVFTFNDSQFSQFYQQERSIIKTIFLISRHLEFSARQPLPHKRICFCVISRLGGYLCVDHAAHNSVFAAGLSGLVKSLKLEWPHVFCRYIDIASQLSADQAAEQIFNEIFDENEQLLEVGIATNIRQTLIAVESGLAAPDLKTAGITADSVFLVSGGAKGITGHCVKRLAEEYHCKFILFGRSAIDFDIPAWAEGIGNEKELKKKIYDHLKNIKETPTIEEMERIYQGIVSKREIDTTLDEIKKSGGQCIYIKGDITRLKSFEKKLLEAINQLGTVTGFIHGAGILADKLIEKKQESDFERVFSTKIDGLLEIFKVIVPEQLEHIIFFSSIAGFYGNIGQSDYAIANEVLNKLALLFKQLYPDKHILAVNWGPWETGMVTSSLKEMLLKNQVPLIEVKTGTRMLLNEMNLNHQQRPWVIIGNALPKPAATNNTLERITLNDIRPE